MILEQHSSAIVKRHEKFGKHRSAFPIVLSIHYIVSNKHQNFVQSSIVNRITNELDFQVCFRFVAFYCRSKPAARTSGFHWTDCVFRNIIQCFLTTCKDTYFIRNKRNHSLYTSKAKLLQSAIRHLRMMLWNMYFMLLCNISVCHRHRHRK